MELSEAEEILGFLFFSHSVCHLEDMKVALESMTFLNDEEENRRLEAVKTLLKAKKKR